MNIFNVKTLSCSLIGCLLATVATAQTQQLSDEGVLLERIVAVVNDGIVLQSELNSQVTGVLAALAAQEASLPTPDVIRQRVLENLIIRKIQLQLAEITGIIVSDEMLNQSLQRVAQRAGIPFSELPAALEADGIDYSQYREHSREELVIDILIQRDVARRIIVSPKEMEAWIASNKTREDLGREYELSHILIAVPPTGSPTIQKQAAERAEDIYLRLESGEDFCELALAYSDGQQALECGSLGWRVGNGLPAFLGDVVIGMKAGEISEPIHNPSGYHIVRLNDTRGSEVAISIVAQNHVRHILVETNDVIDDETARQELLRIKIEIEEGGDFATIAKSISKDLGSSTEGGDLGWVEVGTFVPEFEQMIVDIPVGVLSEPFKTSFGWHLIEVLGQREFDNTEQLEERRAAQQIRQAKLQEQVEIWIQRLREDAFVEYRL